MRLLLVEDDEMIGASIQSGLRHEGYAVDWVRDGAAAEAALAAEPAIALVMLDLGLPRKDGFAILEGLRARRNSVPVLIVTARDAVADRVRGLDLGADDYLVKPFDLVELAARIRALLRRRSGRAEPIVEHAGFLLDPARRTVTYRGRDVAVSAREYALLHALLERPGRPVPRRRLEEDIYGWGEEVASNAIEVHVHNLRKKLGEQAIRTVRGLGYAVAIDRECPSVAPSS